MKKLLAIALAFFVAAAVFAETKITLNVNGKTLHGTLNGSIPAQSLARQLPLEVTIYDSGNDFCGDRIKVDYKESDVQFGYKNGDIAFWPPASNFVIFVNGEESSSSTGDLVILGHLDETQETLDSLHGTLKIRISKE